MRGVFLNRAYSTVAKGNLEGKIVTVFGGSGFLGRNLVPKLSQQGAIVRVFTRSGERIPAFKSVANVEYFKGNISDKEKVEESLKGAYGAVNLVGLLFERGSQSFSSIHSDGSANISESATKNSLQALVHISAIGANSSSDSDYAKTKRAGELTMFKNFPTVSVLRPSIVFGPEDNFFNQFATLSKFLPGLPLFGGGMSRFQPVYVEDVSAAIIICLRDPVSTKQAIYELGGPEVFTFRQLMELTLQYAGRSRLLIPIPWPIAHLQGLLFGLLPTPLLTQDQVRLLRKDNVVSADCPGFAQLGIVPKSLRSIVPGYLSGQ